MQELFQRLAAPFDPSELEFRAIQWSQDNTKAKAFAYINPRAVMDRLDEVALGQWSSEFHDITPQITGVYPTKAVVKCKLTVAGVVHEGIGESDIFYNLQTIKNGQEVVGSIYNISNEAWKSAESDAFKRAAVHFGVGRYLYSLPSLWLEWDGSRAFGNFKVDPASVIFDQNGNVTADAEAKGGRKKGKGATTGKGKAAPKAPAAPQAPAVAAPQAPVAPPTVAAPSVDPYAAIPEHPESPNVAPPMAAPQAPAAAAPQAPVAPPVSVPGGGQATGAAAVAPSNDGITQGQIDWLAGVYGAAGQALPDGIESWTRMQAGKHMVDCIKAGGLATPMTAPQMELVCKLANQQGIAVPEWIVSVGVAEATQKIKDLIAAGKAAS